MRNRLSHSLRLALAQLNLTVGDIEGNARKIIDNIAVARDRGADLVVFPELAITGYPPEDLLLKQGFVEANMEALQRIAASTKGITAVVGFVDAVKDIYNAAAVIHDGSIVGVQHKFFLPNYGVFDEDRYFQAGASTQVYSLGDVTFGVEVCEDAWYAGGPHTLQSLMGGAQLIVDINSSPFHAGKWRYRERMLGTRATDNSCAIVYLNAVGGQDELVFDGHSLVVGPAGEVLFRAKAFEEQLAIVDVDLSPVEHQRLVDPRRRKARLKGAGAIDVPEVVLSPAAKTERNGEVTASSEPPGELEEVYSALVLGTRDYVNKNGFKEVVLGLSGGIDSAITACIACDALGPERVRVLIMPSIFSSKETQGDAEVMARNLGIRFDYIAINDIFDSYNRSLAGVFEGTEHGIAEENLQARIRGNLLMALSNKFGLLVLTTGNKSEMACGYSTLYGDMAGGFAVIKDVPKTLVYKLSNYRNTISPVIPESIIVRPPSAELKPDQKDQDTLPPYEILDPILEAYVEEDRGPKEITAMGFDEETVRRVIRMVDRNEYKRRQAAPGVKITPKAFGRDRRLPITNRFRE
ncbi:MAG: NAD+ synthase [Armatimonadetes bacterium]|nr:NAD+ synthase [Armatimonadota bacterium]